MMEAAPVRSALPRRRERLVRRGGNRNFNTGVESARTNQLGSPHDGGFGTNAAETLEDRSGTAGRRRVIHDVGVMSTFLGAGTYKGA
jgi:hypothetical protein